MDDDKIAVKENENMHQIELNPIPVNGTNDNNGVESTILLIN